MYWAPAVAMETAVPSYLSLEHKQALASNVIPVNMRESDERGSDPSLPSHTLDGFQCGLLGLCWMLRTNMAWAGASLGHIPGERRRCYCFCLFITSSCFHDGLQVGKMVQQNVNPLFSPCSRQYVAFFSSVAQSYSQERVCICMTCDEIRSRFDLRMMCLNAGPESNEPHRITLYLRCVALSIAEIMTRHRRGCADISICFISISDKAFHKECFILRRSLSPHFSFNQRLNSSRAVWGESVAVRFAVSFFSWI